MSIQPLDEVRNVIAPLRDAYEGLSHINTSGSVMSNSETVYAGLTYGKNDVNESLMGNENRGMLV